MGETEQVPTGRMQIAIPKWGKLYLKIIIIITGNFFYKKVYPYRVVLFLNLILKKLENFVNVGSGIGML